MAVLKGHQIPITFFNKFVFIIATLLFFKSYKYVLKYIAAFINVKKIKGLKGVILFVGPLANYEVWEISMYLERTSFVSMFSGTDGLNAKK